MPTGGSGSGGSMGPALIYTNLSLGGVSPSRGTISLTTSAPTGSFTDWGFSRGSSFDPLRSWVIQQVVDSSSSSSFVRVSITATAPVRWSPGIADPQELWRATYAGMSVVEANMKASGNAYLDRAQFEAPPATTLLPPAAEGYDAGMFYTVEPGVGSLWERSQARTLYGKWAGHFKATPNDAGNTYQKVSNFASYNQLLAANRSYADVLIGPS